jgi:hypothetical protein
MNVTIIFNTPNASHKGETFPDVVTWEAHSSYKFLELDYADGHCLQFNLDNIFSFTCDAPSPKKYTPLPTISKK